MIILDRQSKIGFIGCGRIAGNLATALIDQGYNVEAISSRDNVSARNLALRLAGATAYSSNQEVVNACDVVFVTVPDDAIESTVTALSWQKAQGVVHCAGSRTLSCLDTAAAQGTRVASFHPLQTFPTAISSGDQLRGVGFAVTGNAELVRWLGEVISSFGGIKLAIHDDVRAIYHAAAVMTCGYMVTALQHSLKLWESLDVSSEIALAALMPLMRTTLDNVESYGVNEALTGPIVRGDINTIEGHLESLKDINKDVLEFYAVMGKHAIRCNDSSKLDESSSQQIDDLLSSYLKRVGHSIEA